MKKKKKKKKKKKDSLAFKIFISFKHRNILKKTQILYFKHSKYLNILNIF